MVFSRRRRDFSFPAATSINSDADAIVTRDAAESMLARQQPELGPGGACQHLAVSSRGGNIRSLSATSEAGFADDSDGVLFTARHQKPKQRPKPQRQSTSSTTPSRKARTPRKRRDPPPLPDNLNDGTQVRSASRALSPKCPAREPKGTRPSKP